MNPKDRPNHDDNKLKGRASGDDVRIHSVFTNLEIRRIDINEKYYRPKYLFGCNERELKWRMGEDNVSVRKVMIPLSDKERGMYFWVLFNETEQASYVHKMIIERILSELDKYPNASYYYIDGKKCHANTQEKYIRYLHDYDGAIVLVKARECRTKKSAFYLIGDEFFEVDYKRRFYSYVEEEGREILAACNVYDRYGKFRLGKKHYEVEKMWYANRDVRHTIENLIPEEVFLVSEEVYYELNNVDECLILLYSLFYEKYGYVEAKVGDRGDVWILKSVYDSFIKEQRKVQVIANELELDSDVTLEKYIEDRDLFSGLASESILKKHGYSVSRYMGLSKEQRQQILADIINQGLCSKKNVISRLEFYIKCHNGEKDMYARNKWNEDICFIRQCRFKRLRK